MNEFKTQLALISLGVLFAVCAFAWTAPLVSQSDTTLGENMKIQKNSAVLTEIRAAVDYQFANISTAHDPCTVGAVKNSAAYAYACVSTNKWHRTSNGATW